MSDNDRRLPEALDPAKPTESAESNRAGESPGAAPAERHEEPETADATEKPVLAWAETPSTCLDAAFADAAEEDASPSTALGEAEPSEPQPSLPPDALSEVLCRLEALEEAAASTQQSLATLTRQHEIIQAGLRQLGTQLADAAASLAVPRIQALYRRLLLMYDLVEPAPRQVCEETASLCSKLAIQIEEFLKVNEVQRIETDGEVFDPELHKPVAVQPHRDSGMNDRILSTRRNGFRAKDGSVLRPAEVVIARFTEDARSSDETGTEN